MSAYDEGKRRDIETRLKQSMTTASAGLLDLERSWTDSFGAFACKKLNNVLENEIGEQIKKLHLLFDKNEEIHKACEELESVFCGDGGSDMAGLFGMIQEIRGIFGDIAAASGGMPQTPAGGFSTQIEGPEMEGPQKVKRL